MEKQQVLDALINAYAANIVDSMVDERLKRSELRPYKKDLETLSSNVDKLFDIIDG